MRLGSFYILIFLFYQLVYSQQENVKDNYLTEFSFAEDLQNKMEYDSALFYFHKSGKIAAELNNPVLIANTNRRIGAIYIKMNQMDSAKRYIDKAISLAEHINNDTIKAISNLHFGWIMIVEGSTDSAFNYYTLGLDIFRSINDTIGIAKAYNSMAIYYKNTGDFAKGLENALMASTVFKKSEEYNSYITSLINLGNIYERLNENDTALACYELVYQLSIKHDQPQYISDALINRGVIYYKNGKYEETKREFLKAIDHNKKINNQKDLALIYSNISIIYRRLDEVDKAIESANKSIEIAKEINDVGCQLRALNNLGICYKKLENYSKAKECYEESLELSTKLKYKTDQKNAINNLTNIYEALGDYSTALEYSRKSAVLQDSILSEKKVKAIEELNTKYEVLHLKDQNKISELEKKQILFERNLSISLGIASIALLIMLIVFLRMRTKKNKVIAAQKIKQLEDEKKILSAQSVIVGQEKERKRIARELHDGIGVLLSTASMQFTSLTYDDDPVKAKKVIEKANKMLNKAGSEVRKISHNMMPGVLAKFGLREAIEDLFDEIEETGKIKTDVTMICAKNRLPENMEIMIYRIIQEMINNTLKHSKATHIICKIKHNTKTISIEYADNGIGFDEKTLPHTNSLGIFGIRSRVDYLSGSLDLVSEKDLGTTYKIIIPLTQKTDRSID